MTNDQKPDRPALPRDTFRAQRLSPNVPPESPPSVVTPDYDDMRAVALPAPPSVSLVPPTKMTATAAAAAAHAPLRADGHRNPFEIYGERTSSRPYALRLPDPIDFVLRQLAAEERTHPLRVIDRILYEHLRRIGRLPPTDAS